MAKGGRGNIGGMGNMGNLMKQAQKMQKEMERVQEELEQKEVEVSTGGGAITIVVSGKKEIKTLNIKPQVIDPEDVEMLQDLIIAAVNEGLRKVDDMTSSEMGKLTGGLGGMPGLF